MYIYKCRLYLLLYDILHHSTAVKKRKNKYVFLETTLKYFNYRTEIIDTER